jgi:Fe-S cluster assembly protein SufD
MNEPKCRIIFLERNRHQIFVEPGCTIGQLDDEALFYLRSRGIPFKEAQAMLMYAFANDVLSNVKIPELKEKLNRIIAEKLGVELNIEV